MWIALDENDELDCDVTGLGIAETRKLKELIKKIQKRGGIMARIKVKILDESCRPERTHRWDAGWDLKALDTTVIKPGETKKIHTGVITEIPPRHFGMVVPRSSIGCKHNVTLANDVGVIDAEYRGEIMVFLHNGGTEDFNLEKGMRFCQLLIVPVNNAELWVVDSLSETSRGDGGFGSTTIKVTESPGIVGTPGTITVDMSDVKQPNEKVITDTGTDGLHPVLDVEDARQAKLDALRKLKPSEYMKLKNSGKLFDEYPIATGNMKEDLGK